MKKLLGVILCIIIMLPLVMSSMAFNGVSYRFTGVQDMELGVPVHQPLKDIDFVYRLVLEKPTKLKIDIMFDRKKASTEGIWGHDLHYTFDGDWVEEFLPGGSKEYWQTLTHDVPHAITKGQFPNYRDPEHRVHYIGTGESTELDYYDGPATLLPAGTYYFWLYYEDPWADNRGASITFTIDCIHESTTEKVVTKPTCAKAGKKSLVCNGCDKVIESEKLEKLEHTPAEEWKITDATCAKAGKKELFCTTCKKAIETEIIEILPHTFGDWEIDKEPTCKAAGRRSRVCSGCSKTEREEIPKLSHSIEEWTITKEATEKQKGTRKGKCTSCGKTITENFEKHPGRSGFKKSRDYKSKFSDVGQEQWFHEYVQTAYEYELANGTSDTEFSPNSKFTVAQALTAAANIHRAYYGTEIGKAVDGEEWYVPYVNYCVENNIIGEGQFKDYSKNIKRGEMAEIFAKLLPEEEYANVRSGAPTDMNSDMASYSAVTKLYGAGIVSGDAETGTFRPDDEIVRSEACVIFTRIAVESYRAK